MTLGVKDIAQHSRVVSSAGGSVREPVDFVDGEVPARRNAADAIERAVYVPIPLRICR